MFNFFKISKEQQAFDQLKQLMADSGAVTDWRAIVNKVFRIVNFDRSGTKVDRDDNVIAMTKDKPYGFLHVQSPAVNVKILPITHRDDFLLATTVFDDDNQFFADPELFELLVTYRPQTIREDGRGGDLYHNLHYLVARKGALERYHALSQPMPELIYQQFSWSGNLRVGVNYDA